MAYIFVELDSLTGYPAPACYNSRIMLPSNAEVAMSERLCQVISGYTPINPDNPNELYYLNCGSGTALRALNALHAFGYRVVAHSMIQMSSPNNTIIREKWTMEHMIR